MILFYVCYCMNNERIYSLLVPERDRSQNVYDSVLLNVSLPVRHPAQHSRQQ